MKRHMVLIGCVKTKNKDLFGEEGQPNPSARCTPGELYASQLFKARRQYAEDRGFPWVVLSAKYGLWWPTHLLKPYDMTFSDLDHAEVLAWHSCVCHHLVEELWEPFNLKLADGPIAPHELTLEFHAGAEYCHPLADMLQLLGMNVLLPMAGLQIGEQLSWYKKQKAELYETVQRQQDVR